MLSRVTNQLRALEQRRRKTIVRPISKRENGFPWSSALTREATDEAGSDFLGFRWRTSDIVIELIDYLCVVMGVERTFLDIRRLCCW